jgi:hypothetical protein
LTAELSAKFIEIMTLTTSCTGCHGIRKKKKYRRVQVLVLWIRALRRRCFQGQCNEIHSLFVNWPKEHNETEFLDYWLSTRGEEAGGVPVGG